MVSREQQPHRHKHQQKRGVSIRESFSADVPSVASTCLTLDFPSCPQEKKSPKLFSSRSSSPTFISEVCLNFSVSVPNSVAGPSSCWCAKWSRRRRPVRCLHLFIHFVGGGLSQRSLNTLLSPPQNLRWNFIFTPLFLSPPSKNQDVAGEDGSATVEPQPSSTVKHQDTGKRTKVLRNNRGAVH